MALRVFTAFSGYDSQCMATSPDIPQVYGPTKRSRRVLTDDDHQQTLNQTF